MEDFFDREGELSEFVGALDRRAVVVRGIRRIGKSSLIKVGLGQSDYAHMYLDLRGTVTRGKLSSQTVMGLLLNAASNAVVPGTTRFGESIRNLIQEIGVGGLFTIKFRKKYARDFFVNFFMKLDGLARNNGERLVVVFDEAQMLRLSALDMRALFANIYDNMDNITLVFAGSQVGLLNDFIGVEDARSPLYGRYMREVELKPLAKDLSKSFLERGFEELGIKVHEELIDTAVQELDGIIGWLAFFGLRVAEHGQQTKQIIEDVLDLATNLEKAELESLAPSQRLVLAAISKLSHPSWSDIKSMAQGLAGRDLNDAEVNRALRSLRSLSLIHKEGDAYIVTDPITRRAASTYKTT